MPVSEYNPPEIETGNEPGHIELETTKDEPDYSYSSFLFESPRFVQTLNKIFLSSKLGTAGPDTLKEIEGRLHNLLVLLDVIIKQTITFFARKQITVME